jgi:hypothetical protein
MWNILEKRPIVRVGTEMITSQSTLTHSAKIKQTISERSAIALSHLSHLCISRQVALYRYKKGNFVSIQQGVPGGLQGPLAVRGVPTQIFLSRRRRQMR